VIRIEGALVFLVVAVYAPASRAGQSNQKTFSSAEDAAEALFLTVQDRDESDLSQLLGADEELFSVHDEDQDALDRQLFLEKYRQMHRLAAEPPGTVLYIGAENWPFPVPLTFNDGAWSFDTRAGMSEVLFRRVGENESSAIETCHAFVQSNQDFAAFAESQVPFRGYYFRALPVRGKPPSFLAYPAEYGSSGVMTFVVDDDGVTYERDLGPRTASAAKTMTRSKLDSTWQALQ